MRWVLRVLGGLVALPLALVAGVLILGNTGPGRGLIERQAASLSGDTVRIAGLSGRFPDALRLAHAELRDKDGVYATVDGLALDWSPLRLFQGVAAVDRLAAAHVVLARMPVAASGGSSGFDLPIPVSVRTLSVPRIDIGAPVAGTAIALGLDGTLALASLTAGSADLTLRGLGDAAVYHVRGSVDPARIGAAISAREPGPGLIAGLSGRPGLGPIAADATLDGPRDAVATRLAVSAGPLRAEMSGVTDLTHAAADLTLRADAPAMALRPDLAWQSVHLDAVVRGPFTRPAAKGTLRIAALTAAGASVGSIAADLAGDAGAARLKATLDGIRLPGPKPDLLAAAPLVLTADARLDAADRPVTFTVAHPLVTADGVARTAGAASADAHVHLPTLAPLAAAGGIDLQGHSDLDIRVTQEGDAICGVLAATLAVTGGMAPLPGLVGESGRLTLDARVQGSDVTLSRLALDGRAIGLTAAGGVAASGIALDWTLALPDLSALAGGIGGHLDAKGRIAGPVDDFAAQADLAGDLAIPGVPRGPIAAHVQAEHLPGAPAGRVTAEGELAGAPLALDAAARRGQDGALSLDISRAEWKSAHAEGALTLPQGAVFPLGTLDLRMGRLDDLRPFVGRALTGGITASLVTTELAGKPQARLTLDARDTGMAGAGAVARAALEATVTDPAANPMLDGRLALDGIAVQGIAGSARLDVAGPRDALAARLSASLRNLAGADATVQAAATLDSVARSVGIARLDAGWKGQSLRLLAPVRVNFADGVSLDRLRLGLGQATLEAAGRISPALDLTVALRNVTPDLARAFDPSIDADGTLRADARLTGDPARPSGTIRVEASGLKMRAGPGRGLPPATVTASAELAGETARIDALASAGRQTTMRLTGTAPIDPARPFNLRAAGGIDLAVLDPILTAQGRRARGQLTLDLGLAGTLAAPRLNGTARLANGDVQDFAQGARISAIAAQLAFDEQTIRIVSFTGRAGPGSITIAGSIGALTPDRAVDLRITAVNARPLASDRLSVTLDADLTIRGQLAAMLALSGSIRIREADITIPEKLPPSIAVLQVIRPGQKPAPPPSPGPEIGLDLTISAERAIFVRGRGVFAELAGTVKLGGTSTNPQPLGSFTLRQGNVSVAGQTLTFSKGEVSFNGGSLTDPSIDFVASATNGAVTANLEISGTASAPRITLSSTPELPQDEVLAQLLFSRSTSSLSAFELASLAATLASLTGVGPDIGSPLESLRKDFGLDRLSIGSDAKGNPTLQAGRYVAPGVFVGARQGTSGTSTQGLVQVDLYKGLKLEGTVGVDSNTNATSAATPADSGGSSIGLTYQFEY